MMRKGNIMQIGSRMIGDAPCFIVAETGRNFRGGPEWGRIAPARAAEA
ncbi:hypothetical protein [Pseudodesulfovibrio sp.]|nr:hypothetical protein [Pseudodesulfovibrio sp.]MDD3312399.1 hypothetical protein [Pseudodesulfovibrio sp.]